jgi:hypothetical protein
MVASIDSTSIAIPFGLEFALILAALTFVILIACVLPIAFEMRRQIMRSAVLAEEMRDRIDSLLDECRRAARNVGELAARTNNARFYRPGATTFFKALLHRFL